ncbi:MAG: NapC/NirT family cytochrome c [Gemmatimonadota bacterium]|nr:MAG: NapC/NirT family cytochrome c [Gemmatimonadota bacterium]
MRRLTDFFDRLSRPLKIAIQVGILAVILLALGTVGFIEYSGQPSFCVNCHVMRPYYDSWATSSHNTVKCIQCHYAPGIKAEAMGKVQAANQVVKYITGAYGMKPWAEIEDAACLRSGCHTERELEGAVDYEGVRFDHTHHLGEQRRGKRLRCTSCHSQIVQGSPLTVEGYEIGAAHLRVTAVTCYLCHFKDRPVGDPVAGCTGCHESPQRFRSAAGFVVDHPAYVENMISCVGCHETVTSGTGEAGQRRCFNCHNEPERIEQFENTSLVHSVHIATHNVECTQCHTPILHRVVALAQAFELDCNSCHQGAHDAQRLMYTGMGGHGTENAPSTMFLARVSCQSCHGLPAEIAGHAEVKRAGEATCMSCHGIRYANILPSWQREMERRQSEVASVVAAARSTLRAAPVRTRAAADSLLRLAEENISFVERGKGAHNIAYADQLLRASLQLVQRAVEAGPLPFAIPEVELGAELGANICLQCHLDVSEQAGRFAGRRFDHRPHVQSADLACTECHTALEEHGGITLSDRSSCDGCHHRVVDPIYCANCHRGPGGAPAATISTAIGDFSHAVHRGRGLTCSICHTAPSMSIEGLDCDNCHSFHHQPKTTCLDCHKGGVLQTHPVLAHNGCTICHGEKAEGINEWTRQVCTVCHADKVEHNAPADCHLCHTMPELGEG